MSYDITDYATVVTPVIDAVAVRTGFLSSGELIVEVADSGQHAFSFGTFDLPSATVSS